MAIASGTIGTSAWSISDNGALTIGAGTFNKVAYAANAWPWYEYRDSITSTTFTGDVVLTDNFTEAGLYQAMADRQVYATEDQNLRVYYYLNGELMGSIIDTGDEDVTEVRIKVSISDPDGEALGKIEIIDDLTLITEITTKLSHKFTQDEGYIQEEIRQAAHRTLLLQLTPEHICGKLVTEA